MKRSDMKVGQRFGSLQVEEIIPGSKTVKRRCRVLCICGVRKIVWLEHLRHGRIKSCGCRLGTQCLKHGNNRIATGKTHEYSSWASMIQRCENIRHPSYKNYGARGIKVCARWRKSFTAFLKDMGRCPKGFSIDRINNAGDYKPTNCRWASRYTQSRNYRRNRMLTYIEKTQTLADWATEYGLHPATLKNRLLRSNWSLAEALQTPAKYGNRIKTIRQRSATNKPKMESA